MKFKKIHFIINPSSGQDEPILSYLNKVFSDSFVSWDVSVTKKANDATLYTKRLLRKVDCIAVYGGDGTVSEVAKALIGTSLPLAVVPGGTANVVSKELGIPQNTMQALELLKAGEIDFANLDMGLLNNMPFVIRVNFGIMADMVSEADRELKNKVGQLAYGITALQTMVKSEPMKYKMTIDGEEIVEQGVALTVTNCGSIGIGNYSFLPEISVVDGYLNVILLNEANLLSVLKVAGTTLLQTHSEVLKHWKCQEVEIKLDEPHKIILDDFEMEASTFYIKVLPAALKVVVPKKVK